MGNKKTETAVKDAPKTKKSKAKETLPIESETNQAVELSELPNVFALERDTPNITELNREDAEGQLFKSEKYTLDSIKSKLDAGDVLPTSGFYYSSDKEKLETIMREKGWNLPQEFTDVSDTTEESEFVEPLTVELDETETVSDEPETAPEEEMLLADDPNQHIYDAFASVVEFQESLNVKESSLLQSLSDGKKMVADLSEPQTKLWTSIQAKYNGLNAHKTDGDGQEPIENFRKPDALVKANNAIQGLVEPADDAPLSDEEKARRIELETQVETAKDKYDEGQKAAFVMAEGLAEIKKSKLFRDTHKTFKDYVADRFAIDEKYAHALAQGGHFRLSLSEGGKDIAKSLNAVSQWLRDTNEIGAILHISKSDFETMKPIIESVQDIVTELVTDDDGNTSSAAPRIFQAAQEIIREVVNTGMIEIDGEQISVEDANKVGILEKGIQSQIVEAVAENIRIKKQEIFDYVQDKKKRRTASHNPVEPVKKDKNLFVGVVPDYVVKCDAHPEMEDNCIVNVFNAGFELKCGDKFQKLTTSGNLFVCIESGGKTVQYD